MKAQIKIKSPLKIYSKRYQEICRFETWEKRKHYIGAINGSTDELILKFRNFYKEAHLLLFDFIVKQIWLEQQVAYNGRRRSRRIGNGVGADLVFGQFMKIAVGISQRVLTSNLFFIPVATYLIDFFPDFLFHDPFKEPYEYPYKHVTLDYLAFVYQMDNRLELLDEADRRGMSYAEFINWVTNWALCYNDDIGDTVYAIYSGIFKWPYIRNNKLKRFWENNKFSFESI